jgi:hypothetical protein
VNERPVIGPALQAWRDMARAVSAMPWLVLASAGYVLFLVFVEYRDEAAYLDRPVWLDFAYGAVQAAYAVPLCLAIHRHILLGETTRFYWDDLGRPRFWRFLAWSLGLLAFVYVPALLSDLITNVALATILILLLVPALIIAIRLIVLFPAIAVDAQDIGWREAFAATREPFWRIVAIMLATWMPVLVLGIVVMTAFAAVSQDMAAWRFVVGIGALLCELTAIAVASRLYDKLLAAGRAIN